MIKYNNNNNNNNNNNKLKLCRYRSRPLQKTNKSSWNIQQRLFVNSKYEKYFQKDSKDPKCIFININCAHPYICFRNLDYKFRITNMKKFLAN